MQGVANFLQQQLPATLVASPNGTTDFDGGNAGYQWFSVAGITEQTRPGRIVDARPAFDAAIQRILQQNDVIPGQDKIILLGFSQGAIMALDALVTDRFPLAGVVGFSGRLSSPAPYRVAADSAALLIHGQADKVIDWSESESAAVRLSTENIAVSTFYESGVPHTITANGMHKAVDFIAHRFA